MKVSCHVQRCSLLCDDREIRLTSRTTQFFKTITSLDLEEISLVFLLVVATSNSCYQSQGQRGSTTTPRRGSLDKVPAHELPSRWQFKFAVTIPTRSTLDVGFVYSKSRRRWNDDSCTGAGSQMCRLLLSNVRVTGAKRAQRGTQFSIEVPCHAFPVRSYTTERNKDDENDDSSIRSTTHRGTGVPSLFYFFLSCTYGESRTKNTCSHVGCTSH